MASVFEGESGREDKVPRIGSNQFVKRAFLYRHGFRAGFPDEEKKQDGCNNESTHS